ncbi:hypothetical protein M8J77_012839 [Diaphorina citri]|nr:hypothetical protein M8J77_012839 [Diaphorina citri]
MSNLAGKDKKPIVPGSARCSQIKSTESLTRSRSQLSLDRSRVLSQAPTTTKATVKRSRSVTAKDTHSSDDAVNIMDPEAEYQLHDGLLELYELSSDYSILEHQDLIMSQVLYLQDKLSEKRQALVELCKKFVQIKHSVEMKQNCDQLIPDYVNVINNLESLHIGPHVSELHCVLSHMASRVQLNNIQPPSPRALEDYKSLVGDLEHDLEHLNRVRHEYEQTCGPLIDMASQLLAALGDKVERLESLKKEISRLDYLQSIRSIQIDCKLTRHG